MDNLEDYKRIKTIKYTISKTPLCPFCNQELIRSNIYLKPMPKDPTYLCKNRCIESTSTIADLAGYLANADPTFKHKFRLALAYFDISQQEFAAISGFSQPFVFYMTNDVDYRRVPPKFAIHALYLIERMALDKTIQKITTSYLQNLGLDLQKTQYTVLEEP